MDIKQTLIAAVTLVLMAGPLAAESRDVMTPETHNMELGLPYEPPGRGITDHDALRRRSLAVLGDQFAAFVTETAALEDAARAHCAGEIDKTALRDRFKRAYLAWAPLDSYQFGPIQQTGAVLAVNFWPDVKGYIPRALTALQAQPADRQADPAAIGAGSVAIQGFPALEQLLYEPGMEVCPLAIGISGNLNRLADDLHAAWFADGGWADIARAAGPDNPVYLSADEFTKQLYTAVDFGLTRIAETRLARPLGTFDAPQPERAEAWRSDLSAALVRAQLVGLADLIERGFAGDLREPDRAWILRVFDQALDRLDTLDAPIHVAVAAPMSRVRVEGLQSKILYLQSQIAQDVGPALGVDTGFSAADGD